MNRQDTDLIRQTGSVNRYRRLHKAADDWATGAPGVCHSIETQDRIFRLAEQLRHRLDGRSIGPFFPVLKAIDTVSRWETGPADAPGPTSAAAAALVGYNVLFGKQPPIGGHAWPADVDLTHDAESELVTLGLRATGHEPIVFDGQDPAAYVWALFEIDERNAACREGNDRHRSPAGVPRGLAVISTPVQRRAPAALPPARTRELVGVGS
ncbi:MAG: hypothetical protein ABI401_14160 [Candidatus Dormibacter sp.]